MRRLRRAVFLDKILKFLTKIMLHCIEQAREFGYNTSCDNQIGGDMEPKVGDRIRFLTNGGFSSGPSTEFPNGITGNLGTIIAKEEDRFHCDVDGQTRRPFGSPSWTFFKSEFEVIEEEKEMTKLERIKELENELAALKAQVEEEERVEYPYIGEADGQVVIFTAKKTGNNINGVGNDFGDYAEYSSGVEWAEEDFKKFTGTITYKNGKPVETKEDK